MKTILKLWQVLLLTYIAISCSCHHSYKSNNVEPELTPRCKYDTVTVIYTATEAAWNECRNPYNPKQFKRVYADQLKGMKIWDTTFVYKLTDLIESRDSTFVEDHPDTWILAYLHKTGTNLSDTLTIVGKGIWLNGEKWYDYNIFRTVIEKIMKHDKEWAEIVDWYYVDGEWTYLPSILEGSAGCENMSKEELINLARELMKKDKN